MLPSSGEAANTHSTWEGRGKKEGHQSVKQEANRDKTSREKKSNGTRDKKIKKFDELTLPSRYHCCIRVQ